MNEEERDLAKEHINLAEESVVKEAGQLDGEAKKVLEDAAFALEKAEADLEDA